MKRYSVSQPPVYNIYESNAKFLPVFFLDLACCVVIGIFTLMLQINVIEPNLHGYFHNDTSIYYPKTSGRVSGTMLGLFGHGLPSLIILLFAIHDGAFKSLPRFRFFIHQFLIMNFLAIGNAFVTNSLKSMVGRHRPDFIARCAPDYSTIHPDPVSTYVSSVDVCTGSKSQVLDGHKSFPSGHASQAMFGACFVATYLYRRLPTLRNGRFVSQTARLAAMLIPVCIGLVIGASRSIDNRHHALDIIIGSIIGIIFGCSLFTFGKLTYPEDVSSSTYIPIDLNEKAGSIQHETTTFSKEIRL